MPASTKLSAADQRAIRLGAQAGRRAVREERQRWRGLMREMCSRLGFGVDDLAIELQLRDERAGRGGPRWFEELCGPGVDFYAEYFAELERQGGLQAGLAERRGRVERGTRPLREWREVLDSAKSLRLQEAPARDTVQLYSPSQPRGRDGKWIPGGGIHSPHGLGAEHGMRGRGASGAGGGGGGHPGASSASRSTVAYTDHAEQARATLRQRFGRDLTDHEVAGLAGALPGSHVEVQGFGEMVSLTVRGGAAHDPVTGHVIDESYKAVRYIQPDHLAPGKVLINNWYFIPDPRLAGTGMGVRMLATQVRTARALGRVSYLATDAARRDVATADKPRMDGYWKWARLGYNAEVSRMQFQSGVQGIPRRFGRVDSLLDLTRTPDGLAWWREYGNSTRLQFGLTPGSESLARLNTYLRDHGEAGV